MFTSKISALEEKISSLEGNASTTDSPSTSSRNFGVPMETNTSLHEGVPRELSVIVNALRNNGTEKPRYPGKNSIHPVTFLEDLTSYLRKIYAAPGDLDTIIECLDGEVRNWARIYRHQWVSFEDFKRDFLNTYWGETEQSNLRKTIVQNIWSRNQNPSMLGHFISLVGQAKMLTYPIPEQQLISDLMCHFPRPVQYAWSTNNYQTIIEATEFLRKLDGINEQVYDIDEDPNQAQRGAFYSTKRNHNTTWKNKLPHKRSRELEPKVPSAAVVSASESPAIETVNNNLN